MIEAGLWAMLAASSLVVGSIAGLVLHVPRRWVGLALGFGAGALTSAVAFELTEEAFAAGGALIVASGLAVGALAFFTGNRWLHKRGAARRGAAVSSPAEGQGMAIALGAMLDGIPESVVLGSTILVSGSVSVAFFGAVLLSNVPEAFSATTDLRKEGHPAGWILRLWVGVVLASGIAAALGYALLSETGPAIPFIQSFAAGAILVMLVDTMIPEAFEYGGDQAGLATTLGFALAFMLSAFS